MGEPNYLDKLNAGKALEVELVGGARLYVGKIPGRRHLALGLLHEGDHLEVVAWFRNPVAAQSFLAHLGGDHDSGR